MMSSKLPIGIQSFRDLREKDYKYVDKTHILYNLVDRGKYYFLSRPRRFGKSLFLSTLEAYFLGQRELFRNLAIERLEKDWIQYPVMHLDLNTQNYDTPNALEDILNDFLTKQEYLYGARKSESSPGLRFQGIIQRAYEKTGKQVVILVDEYDKPILQAIGNEALQDTFRAILKSFYAALKSSDVFIRFAFVTGVTKIGKVSVFSDLNHLNDITMDAAFHEICGITGQELKDNFEEEISSLASTANMTVDETLEALKNNYDGYHFCENALPGIYNPFSLLNAFFKLKFGSYWFETGTPTYLVELLKTHRYNLSKLEKEVLTEDELSSIDSASTNPIPIIYQSGYLTIKDYDPRFRLYKLGYPNKEVEEGFLKFLIPFYTAIDKPQSGFEISLFINELENNDIEGFMNHLHAFLSSCPYELQPDQERHFQSVMYILTTLCGFYADVEEHTSKGRMDMTVKTDKYIYIFEFKFNSTAEIALNQILDMGYADKFQNDKRKIIYIGVNYSREDRNINQWLVR